MKVFNALVTSMKKSDIRPMERLEQSKVRATIERYCAQYLQDSSDIFEFEALPNALDATLAVLDSRQFQEKYEFEQVSETCFAVKMRELDLI